MRTDEGIWKIKNGNQTPATDRRRWRLILMFPFLFCDPYNQEQDGARGYIHERVGEYNIYF